ncbi:hypothetical protein [Achromobacter spanius]|uniref:hypothetical protein n=1 Tax=Achromobacter spanius TaxID=217203 RepID=UPI00158153DD|nr:hypothetical protein [Achromobacter spanius]
MSDPAMHGAARRAASFHAGSTVTNVAIRPDGGSVVMTESATGAILEAPLPA